MGPHGYAVPAPRGHLTARCSGLHPRLALTFTLGLWKEKFCQLSGWGHDTGVSAMPG